MPPKPTGPDHDPLAAEVDKLLEKLPGADPSLLGERDNPPGRGARLSFGIGGASALAAGPTPRDRRMTWLWVLSGVALGAGMTQWPYLKACGLALVGYLVPVTIIVAIGSLAAISAWSTRMAIAHVLALGVVGWGVWLWTGQVLQRVGYASTSATWACRAPIIDYASLPRGGYIGRPDNTRLFYKDVGSGTSATIVTDARLLPSTLSSLSDEHRLIFYDTRHRGASVPASTSGHDLETALFDLDAVREYHALERVALVGWSHSGPAVAEFARRFPDRVSRMVLISPLPPTRAQYRMEWDRGVGQDAIGVQILDLMREHGDDRSRPLEYCESYWTTAIIRPRLGNLNALPSGAFGLCRFPNEQPARWEAANEQLLTSLGNWDFTTGAAAYTGDVLVIHGSADPMPIEGAVAWAVAYPNARLHRIEGAGHYPWLEQPEMVRSAVRTFLNGRWPQAPSN